MRVFLTGATGFIGSKLVPELIGAGHAVLGLARSEAGARSLTEAGAEALRGDMQDLDLLRQAAGRCDGVIHAAFDHDFSNFEANCRKDQAAIAALGGALEGSDRPLVITSGTSMGAPTPGVKAQEDQFNPDDPNPRVGSERVGAELSGRGVNVSVMRLSQIHDTRRQGLVTFTIALARQSGVSAYVGEGRTAWSAAHVTDTVRLYRLALERRAAGSRYHATAEEAIGYRAIAEAIGARLGLPVVSLSGAAAAAHFGWLMAFVDRDMSASSAATRAALGWQPDGPGLLADVAALQDDAG